MSTPKRPANPTDLLAWRDQLIAELERNAKTAKGSLQLVLLKMHSLVGGSRPGGSLDRQLFQELQEAYARFSQDPSAQRTPSVIMECLDWVHTCFIAPSSSASGNAGSVAKSSAAVPGAGKSGKDSFESGAAPRARSLTGEVSVASAQPKEQQPQLESVKTWMMNPSLGKVKG
ncbi:hypothetical protein JQX13_30595 [Archangium violaceum]|uniref:hypothetical protein n=1 Tax=Archangium violaceum TaxID=83451 RepID=UPI00193BD77B|nr:hypothetical protein [Archangium violaceum]QRK04588.1 hypothetical protein JQX13_30595 [Archangium violaceum]